MSIKGEYMEGRYKQLLSRLVLGQSNSQCMQGVSSGEKWSGLLSGCFGESPLCPQSVCSTSL